MRLRRSTRPGALALGLGGAALLLTAATAAADDWLKCYDHRITEVVSCGDIVDNRCVSRCKVQVNIEGYLKPAFDILDHYYGKDDAYSQSWRNRMAHQFTFNGFVQALDFLSEEEVDRAIEEAGLRERARKHFPDLERAGLSGRSKTLFRRFLLGERNAARSGKGRTQH